MNSIKTFFISFMLFMPLSSNAQKVLNRQNCVALALKNSTQAKNAQLEKDDAMAQKKQACMLYLPKIMASGMAFVSPDYFYKKELGLPNAAQQVLGDIMQKLQINPALLAGIPQTYSVNLIKNGAFANILAMQPVFMGGRIITANKLAAIQQEVKELNAKQTNNQIIRQVDTYYNTLLKLYAKNQALEAAMRQVKSIHRDVTLAYKAGVVAKTDLLTVEMKVNELEADSLALSNGIRIAKMALAQYIGAQGEVFDIDTMLHAAIMPPQSYHMPEKQALEARPETKLLAQNIEAKKYMVKLRKAELMPSLAVGGGAIYTHLFDRDKVNLVGLAALTIPISDWWSDKTIKSRKIQQQIALNEQEDKRQLLLIQIQKAYADFETAYRMLTPAHKGIEQAQEYLKTTQLQYKAGISTISQLLEAQTKLQQAMDKYTEALIHYQEARTEYLISTARENDNPA